MISNQTFNRNMKISSIVSFPNSMFSYFLIAALAILCPATCTPAKLAPPAYTEYMNTDQAAFTSPQPPTSQYTQNHGARMQPLMIYAYMSSLLTVKSAYSDNEFSLMLREYKSKVDVA